MPSRIEPPWPPQPEDPVTQTYYTTFTVVTAAPHGLAVGQTASITGNTLYNLDSAVVVAVIDAVTLKVSAYQTSAAVGTGGTLAQSFPGLVRSLNIVTATTAAPHGFYPGQRFTLSGVPDLTAGTITAALRAANVVTITTSAAHGLAAGQEVTITGVTDVTFNGVFTVESVTSATTFTLAQLLGDASSSGGTVTYSWDGTFFVFATPTDTSFTYRHVGPDASYSSTGTVTPIGQIAGGPRNCVLMFETRQGFITAPSPSIGFAAEGNKQLLVEQIAIGPPNVTRRILAFTGINGGDYFYIDTPAYEAGQKVSTSTVLEDNTSTSLIVDFSDETLLSSTPIDVPGNNLFAQVVLGPCLGVTNYADRMLWWGERNKVNQLVNMGFEGGYTTPDNPLGWDVQNEGGQLVSDGDFEAAWKITAPLAGGAYGQIKQWVKQDPNGNAVLKPNTRYKFRVWIRAEEAAQPGFVQVQINAANATVVLTSASIPISSASTTGTFLEGEFDADTPAVIPSDTFMFVYAVFMDAGKSVTIDEMELIYADDPYLDRQIRVSYAGNYEAFDGLTGVLGTKADPNKIMATFLLRDNLYLLTRAPNGRLHATQDLSNQEPDGWNVNEMARQCGAFSVRSATSGEDWAAWMGDTGLRIFDGGHPSKLSQEIQSLWDGINADASPTSWIFNDPIKRILYCGLPTGSAQTPNQIYPLDYRELDRASEIAGAAGVHMTMAGRMSGNEQSRKWTRWNITANHCDYLGDADGSTSVYFAGGNGAAIGTGAGFGNIYWLNDAKYTDDDYGAIDSYYVTYFFVTHDQEQQLQLGSHRKLYSYLALYLSGVGQITITPYRNALWNPAPLLPARTMSWTPELDEEWGMNVTAQRCAFKLRPIPLAGQTDRAFNTGKMIVSMKADPMAPVGGVR
jgi:hypothetical protein